MADRVRIPIATYRLQMHMGFGFTDVALLVQYLDDLGITDCYLSPILRARPGSTHGHDVIDHNSLNPDLGSEEDFDALALQLRQRGMGLLLDIVPDHVGIYPNAWWDDVLAHGPSSPYAGYFEIDWNPPKPELANKVVLPLLGSFYGEVLEQGELTLSYEAGSFVLSYYERRLPISAPSSAWILRGCLGPLQQRLGIDSPPVLELRSLVEGFGQLKASEFEQARMLQHRLQKLVSGSEETNALLEENVRRYNGDPTNPESFDALAALVDQQHYRLVYWRVPSEEINYRRFFNISELPTVRAEHPAVFAATHRLILRLLRQGKATGLRIDSIDSLSDPAGYLYRLQHAARLVLTGETEFDSEDLAARLETGQFPDGDDWSCYVVVDTRGAAGDELPVDWAAHGTTGYDSIAFLDGVFVNPKGEPMLTRTYAQFAGSSAEFAEVAYRSRKDVQENWWGEILALAHRIYLLSDRNRQAREFSLSMWTEVIREVLACWRVYGTYTQHGHRSAQDPGGNRTAVRRVREKSGNQSEDCDRLYDQLHDSLRDILLLNYPRTATAEDRLEQRALVSALGRTAHAVGLVGIEDTAFYRYNRLVSLNEIGSWPGTFGTPLETFHTHMRQRLRSRPHSLLATTTHDTKRSEDVRARIHVLSEMGEDWSAAVRRWAALNSAKRSTVDDRVMPDRNDEILLYQTLLGAWPLEGPDETFRERIQNYMLKAAREARVNTRWTSPDPQYEEGLRRFVHQVFEDAAFLRDFELFEQKIALCGMFNSLGLTLLKVTAPGVPDIYQGSELWNLTLVDPDNLRPVDYERRAALLDRLRNRIHAPGENLSKIAADLVIHWRDGTVKMYVIHRALTFRREQPNLFRSGDYQPVEATGPKREHVCAFARRQASVLALTVVPRFVSRLLPGDATPLLKASVWRNTWLQLPEDTPARFCNLFTGEPVEPVRRRSGNALALDTVLVSFPVALLVAESAFHEPSERAPAPGV